MLRRKLLRSFIARKVNWDSDFVRAWQATTSQQLPSFVRHAATLSNYFDVLTLQMESGVPLIDFTSALRDTLSQYYWDPLIEYLFELGIDVSCKTNSYIGNRHKFPIEVIVYHGAFALLPLFLEVGSAYDSNRQLLSSLLKADCFEHMDHFFDRHEDVNMTVTSFDTRISIGTSNCYYSSFLHEAVKLRPDTIDSLAFLLRHNANVHKQDVLGFSPLALAVKQDYKKMAKGLIAHDINTLLWRDKQDGSTLLHFATSEDMLRFLLEFGLIDLNRNSMHELPYRNAALHIACQRKSTIKHVKLPLLTYIRLLVEYGADASNPVEDDKEMWAISLSLKSGHADQEVLQLLVDAGANVDLDYHPQLQ